MTSYDLAVRRRLDLFIARVGRGFHPDFAGAEYKLPDGRPLLTAAEAAQLDADLALFEGDIYAFARGIMRDSAPAFAFPDPGEQLAEAERSAAASAATAPDSREAAFDAGFLAGLRAMRDLLEPDDE